MCVRSLCLLLYDAVSILVWCCRQPAQSLAPVGQQRQLHNTTAPGEDVREDVPYALRGFKCC